MLNSERLVFCAVGVSEGDMGVNFGTVDYWVRLRVPMEQALRLYKVMLSCLIYEERFIT